MKKDDAIKRLAALAQDSRLDVFRLLVKAGPDGMAAGETLIILDALVFWLVWLRWLPRNPPPPQAPPPAPPLAATA